MLLFSSYVLLITHRFCGRAQKSKKESENSWTVNVKDIDQITFDLSAKNPNKKEETALRQPKEILEEMKALDKESADILNSILELI
ncbi:MAG: methylase, type restriction enzyme protein [Candidatus Brocadiaceae bacterium]|nr:methylase, type restriction enzyme protein [Candidatus Brocadiaceae bacterium]